MLNVILVAYGVLKIYVRAFISGSQNGGHTRPQKTGVGIFSSSFHITLLFFQKPNTTYFARMVRICLVHTKFLVCELGDQWRYGGRREGLDSAGYCPLNPR